MVRLGRLGRFEFFVGRPYRFDPLTVGFYWDHTLKGWTPRRVGVGLGWLDFRVVVHDKTG